MLTCVTEKRSLNAGNEGLTRLGGSFLGPFMPKKREMALPVLTKAFVELSPDMAMQFAPCQ